MFCTKTQTHKDPLEMYHKNFRKLFYQAEKNVILTHGLHPTLVQINFLLCGPILVFYSIQSSVDKEKGIISQLLVSSY